MNLTKLNLVASDFTTEFEPDEKHCMATENGYAENRNLGCSVETILEDSCPGHRTYTEAWSVEAPLSQLDAIKTHPMGVEESYYFTKQAAYLFAAAPQMLHILERLEFSKKVRFEHTTSRQCPWCERTKKQGHLTVCDYKLALNAARGQEPA
jgi:hypothetical protein